MLLAAIFAAPSLWAEEDLDSGPTPQDGKIAKGVAEKMHGHFLGKEPDDEISRRCLQNFITAIDPSKDYFTAKDIAEFETYATQLDDLVKNMDLKFPFLVYNRFLERMNATIPLVEEFLEAKHDYSIDESMITDPDRRSYAATEAEVRDNWRRRVKQRILQTTVIKRREQEKKERDATVKVEDLPEGVEVSEVDEPASAEGAKRKDAGEAPKSSVPSVTRDPSPYADLALLELAREDLRKQYKTAWKYAKLDRSDLLALFLSSLTSAYDPHSVFWSAKQVDRFEIEMKLELDGIGAALNVDADGYTKVKEIIRGGAAHRDGRLKPKDRIVGVGQGEEGAMVDVVGMKLDEVVTLVRGKRGTVVRLEILPHGQSVKKTYVLTRARIQLEDQRAVGQVFDAGTRADGKPYKVGIIELPSFYRDMNGAEDGVPGFKSTTRDVRAIIDTFKEKGVDGVVLDLRFNGGGALSEAIDLTGLFIDRGVVVKVADADDVQTHEDENEGAAWKGPLVVLTNVESASASEIFAGAIQDYERGIVVGDPATHGKGTVQRVEPVGSPSQEFGALKITMQKFYRPSGESTQNKGVIADIVLPSIYAHFEGNREGDLDYAIPYDTIDPSEFTPVNLVDAELIRQLAERSRARREASEGFQREARRIDRVKELNARTEVTLNAARFVAEDEAARALGLEEEEAEEDELGSRRKRQEGQEIRAIDRTFLVEEVLAITADYIRLGKWPSEPAALH
ncbi:MAG: carboxy terminal-processing peptidase [Planctomycetes bacterium]|nr:carboxy terminal-processing peptidase [Planctomycetota bacterium]